MKKFLLTFSLIFSAFVPSLKAQEVSTQAAPSQLAQAQNSYFRPIEHCKTISNQNVCYVQTTDEEGVEIFIMTDENAESMQLNLKKIDDLGVNIHVVSQKQYDQVSKEKGLNLIGYDVPAPLAKTNDQAEFDFFGFNFDMECSLSIAGGMGLGGLGGASFGPLGLTLGAIAGGMGGAAAGCF